MKKYSTIHKKIFTSMTVISTICILVLLVCNISTFYYWFRNVQKKNSIYQLQYISDQLSSYLDTVENYSKSIIVNQTIQHELRKYNYNQNDFTPLDKKIMTAEINRTLPSTPFIHSAIVYSADYQILATTEIRPNIHRPVLKNLTSNGIWIPTFKYRSDNRDALEKTFSYIRPFYNCASGSLLGYIEIAISEKSISQIYGKKSNEHFRIFIIDNNGIIQSTSNPSKLSTYYSLSKKILPLIKERQYLQKNQIIFFLPFSKLHWYIINEVDITDYLRPTFQAIIAFFLTALFCGILSMIVSHRISITITQPIYALINHTKKIKNGIWEPMPKNSNYSANSDIKQLVDSFNSMVLAQEQLKNDLLESQRMKDKLSLDLLQQQIRPHFLYNTLDNICSLAELNETETLIDLVMNLSSFYRSTLSNGKNEITIQEELNLTESYLHIMQIRYFNKFAFEIHCPPHLLHCKCLKLLLQPIVENSIYHGIKVVPYKGILKIFISEGENCILFTVIDNGIGLPENFKVSLNNDEEGSEKHFGIKNIQHRIELYYGPQYGLILQNAPGGGCICTIRIKKQEVPYL